MAVRRLHDRRERWVARYIRDLADEMGLSGFRFTYTAYPPAEQDEDPRSFTKAQIDPLDGKNEFEIKVHADFLGDEPHEQRYTLVHELVHVHLKDMDFIVRRDLEDVLSKEGHAILSATYLRTLESAVDSIAESWAEQLPLPPIRYWREEPK